MISASSPESRVEDVPVPSVESPGIAVFELPDAAATNSASYSTYDNIIDTLKQVNLSPPEDDSRIFRFGHGEASSTFTFRNLHNTTPEPSTHAAQITRAANASVPELDSGNISLLLSTSTGPTSSSSNMPLHPTTKLRASSAPAQPPAINQSSKLGRYNTNDEKPPNEPYFDEEFQKALQKAKSVAGRIANILDTCELARDRDSHVFSMIQTANRLRQFDAPSVCTIGIVGDSGVGMYRKTLFEFVD
jgi:hypothetical protein